ncbi:MAG: flagellar biosynthetic protein FliO [Fibrobacterota bacterium]
MNGLIRITCFLCVLTALPVLGKKESAGEFDIHKVQQAIAENQKKAPTQPSASDPAVQKNQPEPESVAAIISRIVAYLALIILVVLVIFWFVKRSGAVTGSKGGGGVMDVLETLPVGQGRMIVLVRVMDNVLILAQTQQNITMLDKIEGQKAVEMIASTKDGTSIVQFKDVFNNFVNKMKKPS